MIELEKEYFGKGFENIIAADEVGVSAIAGPLTVCAVLITKDIIEEMLEENIKDSKLYRNKEELYRLAEKLKLRVEHRIVDLEPRKITNIYRDTIKLKKRAVSLLLDRVSDKSRTVVFWDLIPDKKFKGVECVRVVSGGEKSISIAIASIIAKDYRDKYMKLLAKEYDVYFWERNVGYATKDHIEALRIYGASKYHRINFSRCIKLLESI